jgi:hypothetical protein
MKEIIMSSATKISNGTKYRKVYLSDLSVVLDIYKKNQESNVKEAYAFQIEKLTAQFGLPLAIAECNNELIGFTSAKMNAQEEIEFISYYKNGIGQSEMHSDLEQLARNTFNSTFNNGPGAEKRLSNAAHRLIDWLNKCL